ncbi:MAG: hypothetical protein HOP03_02710 [Lysobacter sp.]|nr:hypothetical protein [Lysobacter sp.]
MSGASRNRELRMEMLRMRAAVERGEVAASLRELRGSTGRLRDFASVAGTLGAAVSSRSSWVGLLASSVTGRPWLAALALGAVRALKRRPLLAAVAIGAVAIGMRATKKNAEARMTGSRSPDA